MIIVSAATGEYGRLVVEHLLQRVPTPEVAVAVRNPTTASDLATHGVQVRPADYDDPATLVAAFRGADRLLFGTDSSFFPRGWQRPVHDQQKAIVSALGLPAIDEAAILGGNFDRLFRPPA